MPTSCCAVGCTNRKTKRNPMSFFRLPADETRRKLWLQRINRKDWNPEKGVARVCGCHFISGQPVNYISHPDYAPSLFVFHGDASAQKEKGRQMEERYKRKLSRCSQRSEIDNAAEVLISLSYGQAQQSASNDKGTSTDPCPEIQFLNDKICNLTKKVEELEHQVYQMKADKIRLETELKNSKFCFENIKNDKNKFNFFTGMCSVATFLWIVGILKENTIKPLIKSLSFEDHLTIILLKVKLGHLNKDIAYRYAITPVSVSRILKRWMPILSGIMQQLIIWPSKLAVRQHLPKSFEKNYKNARCIIDCTEIFTERPLNLTARAQTWSNYKHNNTVKYLIGITPAGAVSFLSQGFGGRASDKEITYKSGFLDKIQHGDDILADRGFLIREDLAIRGATLRIPHFTKGKQQLSAAEVDVSRRLSRVRIHVERVIGRMKKFKILQTSIPVSQVYLLDHILVIIAGLTNLSNSVVPRR